MTPIRLALLSTAALAVSAPALLAAPAVALVGDRTLAMFDTDAPGDVTVIEATGVEALAGIDLRPADRTLVGVTTDGRIVTIDRDGAEATAVSTLSAPLPEGEGPVIVDFNPMADRMRLMRGVANHRVNADTGEATVDGALAFEAADMHAGEAPNIVAAAYTNAFGKPEATAMYDIDATIGALIRQTKPNDGTLAAVGKLGIAQPAETWAFDIHTSEDGTNAAWLVNGTTLYAVDLETGAATPAGEIGETGGAIRDIAILPAM